VLNQDCGAFGRGARGRPRRGAARLAGALAARFVAFAGRAAFAAFAGLALRGAAVRFALANHNVSAAVLGPRSKEQLEQLVRETGGGPRYLHDDDLRQLPRALDKIGIHT
jgi:aryl-alcohol dehydrogenase-like predicted oxidoreductase